MHRLTSMRGNLVIPREGGLVSLGLGPAFTLPPHVWSGSIPWTNVDRTRWGEPAHPWEMMKVGGEAGSGVLSVMSHQCSSVYPWDPPAMVKQL